MLTYIYTPYFIFISSS